MGGGHTQPHDRRDEGTTVAAAAVVLGITEGAVRKRVERGKLAAERTPDGRRPRHDCDRHDTRPTATVASFARLPLHEKP